MVQELMYMLEFDWKGFDVSVEEAIEMYPGTAEKKLRKATREIKKLAETSYDKSITGNLKGNWHAKYDTVGSTSIEGQVYSKSPHYHLVERGHALVKNGKTIGHVPGKFFFKKMIEGEGQRVADEQYQALMKALARKLKGRK